MAPWKLPLIVIAIVVPIVVGIMAAGPEAGLALGALVAVVLVYVAVVHYRPREGIGDEPDPSVRRRLLVRPGPDSAASEAILAAAAIEMAERSGISGVHITFLTEGEWSRLGKQGLLQRTGQQFHWRNTGYGTFDDYLATLASRKRKVLKRERRDALEELEVRWITGSDITESHWDAFYEFYQDTGSRKWGRPYLNRKFFSLISEKMADRIVLMFAYDNGEPIAGTLSFLGKSALYGRYWGATRHVPFLHFELFYYQAIDFAISHKLPLVEAGAQGEHKLARGYEPSVTRSAHWISHPGLRAAIADYLVRERAAVAREQHVLEDFTPFKKA